MKTLLVTKDGVEIHDTETVWVVRDICRDEPEELKILENVFDLYKDRGYLFFSKRSVAHDYVYWNRPIYSRKDFRDGLIY